MPTLLGYVPFIPNLLNFYYGVMLNFTKCHFYPVFSSHSFHLIFFYYSVGNWTQASQMQVMHPITTLYPQTIMFTDLCMLNQPHVFGINPIRMWYVIFLMCYCIVKRFFFFLVIKVHCLSSWFFYFLFLLLVGRMCSGTHLSGRLSNLLADNCSL